MENYFNYFTEIEEFFQRRRGGALLLSTLDWALIETWKDAGIPLAAVQQGIEAAFDKYEKRPSKSTKVNSLAYCAQGVLAAAEEMKEAGVGVAKKESSGQGDRDFQALDIANFLRGNAAQLEAAKLPERSGISAQLVAQEAAEVLRSLAAGIAQGQSSLNLENLERHLTLLEEKLFAMLLAATPDDQVLNVRAEADRQIAPYRRKMPAAQVQRLQQQFEHKRLLEKYGLPRLSLFYM